MGVGLFLKLLELLRVLGHHVEAECQSRARSLKARNQEANHVNLDFLDDRNAVQKTSNDEVVNSPLVLNTANYVR